MKLVCSNIFIMRMIVIFSPMSMAISNPLEQM
jgi:hypothetical protein